MFSFDKRLQIRQADAPEAAILLEPGIDSAERLGIELVDAVAAFAVLPHQMSPPQQAQVFRDRRAGNRKRPGNLPGRLAAPPQKVENSPARGVGESLEGGLRGICNRSVSHNA